MRLGHVFSLLLMGGPALFADVVTNVTCAPYGAASVSASNFCNVAPGIANTYASASASGTVVLPASASDALIVTASSRASVLPPSIIGQITPASASSAVDVNLNLFTSGPMRQGTLEILFNPLVWAKPYSGTLSADISAGSYNFNNPNGFPTAATWLLPFNLGTAFVFDFNQSVTAATNAFDGFSGGIEDSQIELMAFEADGTTAVQLFDPPSVAVTPEPATIGLCLLAVACLVLPKLRRTKRLPE